MSNLYSQTSIKRFFHEIYTLLTERENNKSGWFEISEISFFKNLDKFEIAEFLSDFDFIEIKKGNYNVDYISINKILFVMESIKILRLDLSRVSELLHYSGFEVLINEILSKNNYKVLNNFRFSDKSNFKSKTSQKRYEIDVIGMKLKDILIIDAKQWKRKDSYSSMNRAANLQLQRAIALKKNPDAFSRLIHSLLGINPNLKNALPFRLIPLMVTLEDNSNRLNDNQIPLVSIYYLNSFLQEFEKNSQFFKKIKIRNVNTQKKLL